MQSEKNPLVRSYAARINPDVRPAEAYGYWLIVTAVIVAVVGIAAFLWGSAFPRGDATYWGYRRVGIALAGVALPVAMYGMTLRLPLQPSASAVGAVGVMICAGAVVWFWFLYPAEWTLAGPRPVILTYTGGLSLLGVGMTVVPFVVSPLPADRDPEAVRLPHYALVRLSDGWGWRLHGSDGGLLAQGDSVFGDRESAKRAIDRISAKAPTAGVEVTEAGGRVDEQDRDDETRLG
jgi:hypothetical protein